ncbi:unnamed protein product [Prorocentrum cordatum]|uniref:Histidine phosphatase family protein n=1 Tax=Prorocentrum cordatum TaxID=2364126 RepID=A0ABN9X8L0_9DINO|nr:unnamed protein product [Polarella glacialis]
MGCLSCRAHELARENYRGLDPSIYDAHRGSDELAAEFPGVDFRTVRGPAGPGLQADPIWWGHESHCGDVLEAGDNEASHASRAWHLMCWIMDRRERDVALATHSLLLLAVFHGALDLDDGQGGFQPPASAQIFRTGELRSVLVTDGPRPPGRRPRPAKPRGGPGSPRGSAGPARRRPRGRGRAASREAPAPGAAGAEAAPW